MQGKIRQLWTDVVASSTSQSTFTLPPGRYESLLFRFSGTADTAQTWDPTDVGELDLNVNGENLSRIPFSVLDDINQMKEGIFSRVSGAASTFDWWISYPFAWFSDKSTVFPVAINETVRATIVYGSNLATALGANNLTVRVFGVEKQGETPYILHFDRLDADLVASSTKEYVLPQRNIIALFVENNSDLDVIRYQQDGEQVIDAIREALINQTHKDNRLETYSATFPLVELNFNRNDDMRDILNSENIIQLLGESSVSDSQVTLTIVWLEYTDALFQQSLVEKQSNRARKLQQKSAVGDNAAVEVVSKLS